MREPWGGVILIQAGKKLEWDEQDGGEKRGGLSNHRKSSSRNIGR
jgi:hypothetical protein